ncbi:hypothetical protein CH268_27215 [Rhodococcus sp. 06-1460-1B]|nr:hypothetical protein CH268_27215 [Rhodococcus sp. 06-1460-1B]
MSYTRLGGKILARGSKIRSTLVVIPSYGRRDLLEKLVADLVRDRADYDRLLVIDNLGDPNIEALGVATVREPTNLRWIGSVNWALAYAVREGFEVLVVLNSDVRISIGFVEGLAKCFHADSDVAVTAPLYDDFWPHQRANSIPKAAALYQPNDTLCKVKFVDGTALAFSVPLATCVGLLDSRSFDWHGYGADLDYCVRVRQMGLSVAITGSSYLSHVRRASMDAALQDETLAVQEVKTGMEAKYGPSWRRLIGLNPAAFEDEAGRVAEWSWYQSDQNPRHGFSVT